MLQISRIRTHRHGTQHPAENLQRYAPGGRRGCPLYLLGGRAVKAGAGAGNATLSRAHAAVYRGGAERG